MALVCRNAVLGGLSAKCEKSFPALKSWSSRTWKSLNKWHKKQSRTENLTDKSTDKFEFWHNKIENTTIQHWNPHENESFVSLLGRLMGCTKATKSSDSRGEAESLREAQRRPREAQKRAREAQARPRRGPQRDSRGDWDGPVRREERGTRPASDWCAGSDELAELLGGWLAVGWPVCRPGQACHCTPRHGGPVLRGSSGLGPQHISGVRLHLHCGPAPAWDALRLQGLPGPRPAGGQQGLQEHAQHRGVLHLRQQLLRECTEGDQAPHA